jgi:hypothetical protein
MWYFESDEVNDQTNHKIDSQETMVTICWGIDQFRAFESLSDAYYFNNQYFCDIIVPILNQNMPRFRVNCKHLPRRIHMDNGNASFHVIQASGETGKLWL